MKCFIMTVIALSMCATQASFASDKKSGEVDCTKVEQSAALKKASAESNSGNGEQTKISTVRSAQ